MTGKKDEIAALRFTALAMTGRNTSFDPSIKLRTGRLRTNGLAVLLV